VPRPLDEFVDGLDDGIVQLTRDPQTFLLDPSSRLLFARALGQLEPFEQQRDVGASVPHRFRREERHGDERGVSERREPERVVAYEEDVGGEQAPPFGSRTRSARASIRAPIARKLVRSRSR
jgi:hypothetical protein